MVNFVKKFWPGIVAIAAIALVVFLSVLREEKTRRAPPPTPTPTPFGLIGTYPPEGERPFPVPSLAIDFTFSKEIDTRATVVKVEPFVGHEVNNPEGKVLSIYPPDGWQYDITYTITIEPVAKDGERLSSPVVYSFTPTFYTESDLVEPPHGE